MDDVLFGLKKQGGLYVPSKGGIFGTAFAATTAWTKLELLAENVRACQPHRKHGQGMPDDD